MPPVVVVSLALAFAVAAVAVAVAFRATRQFPRAALASEGPAADFAGEIASPTAVTALAPVPPLAVAPPPSAPKLHRIGGHVIDVADWPAEVVEKIRKEYLLPPAKDTQYLIRVDLTATCPARHAPIERVSVMARNAGLAHRLADGLPRARISFNCPECGKQAKATGKSIAWEGVLGTWDGAT